MGAHAIQLKAHAENHKLKLEQDGIGSMGGESEISKPVLTEDV